MSQKVFVMGPPRSGTTAIVRLLMSHRDVLLADAELLGTSRPNSPTYYESGIFLRGASDDEIRSKFAELDGSAKVIVEKTPTHILQVDRIRRMFPDALLIATHREPVSCMLSWKVAARGFIQNPPVFARACHVWTRSTNAVVRNKDMLRTIDFHDFMDDPSSFATELFDLLSLDNVEECLSAMNSSETERVKGVVGESVRGGSSTLGRFERMQVRMLCGAAENRRKAAFPRAASVTVAGDA